MSNNNALPRSGNPWPIIIGDWLVLILFVFIGQQDHQITGVSALPSLLITTVSLAIPWTIASLLLGGYWPERFGGWQSWLGRTLTIWLVAAPLGLIIRALLRGQETIIVVFMLVLMGIGGLFLLGWRGLVWWWRTRQVTKQREAQA